MRINGVLNLLGKLLLAVSLLLLTPVPVSFIFGDNTAMAFVLSSVIGMILGLALILPFRPTTEMGTKDGFVIVVLSWIAISFLGALPFRLSDVMPSFVDAFFESMSGFTTTGSSIIIDVDVIPPSINFWRAMTHWLGGMGIIVLGLAILPMLHIGGMQLFQAEVAGPTKDKLAPRIQDTARILWGVYLLLTLLETLLLMLGGVDFFDALCHSFATLATGGFSTHTASVAHFDSLYVEMVVVLFMLLGAINFALHFKALHGNFMGYLRNEEFRCYLLLLAGGTCCIVLCNSLSGSYSSWGKNLRDVVFSLMSVSSTTGFATADFDSWPEFSKMLLMLIMCVGGCAGSTSGGLKVVRFLLFFKIARNQLIRLLHPRQATSIKLDQQTVPPDVLMAVLSFLMLYIIVLLLASLAVAATGADLITSVTAVIATINGAGPGLAKVGPAQNFAHLSDGAKLVLCGSMLAGRLEFFTIAVLFTPQFWKMVRRPEWRWQRPTEPQP